jgi:hypothetical protein
LSHSSFQYLTVKSFAAHYFRGQQDQTLMLKPLAEITGHLFRTHSAYDLPTDWTVWFPYFAEEETKVVVDLSNRGHGRASPHLTTALINGNSWWHAAYFFRLGSVENRQVLTRKGRKTI